MNVTTIAGLYGAGLLTFASPCVLPLLPVYVGILGGASASSEENKASRLRRAGIGFAVGLGAVFVALGMGASVLATSLAAHRRPLMIAAGILMVVFGLKLVGLFKSRALDQDARPFLDRVPAPNGFFGGALFGGAFALGWTPCVGPVLGATLTYAASSTSSPWLAGLELAIYAAGLATPLVAAAFFASRVLGWAKALRAHTLTMQRATGVLLMVLGGVLIADRTSALAPTIKAEAKADTEVPCATSATACAKVIDAPPSAERLTGKPRLVEFVSKTCTVCAKMHPIVESLAKRCAVDGSLLRISVDDDAGRALASRYGVRVVPTFVSVDSAGSEVERLVGEQSSSRLAQALGEVRGEGCPDG